MKLRSIRVALLSAFVLAGQSFVFAGAQPTIHKVPKSGTEKPASAGRTVDHRATGAKWDGAKRASAKTDSGSVARPVDTAFHK